MDFMEPVPLPTFFRELAPTEMQETENKYPELIEAIKRQESGCDTNAIGDKHLDAKAYGCLQIRQPAVDDVNRIYGTKHNAEDMRGNEALSIWIFHRYMEIYATEARLGRPVTDEDRARIWNGGPNGWKRRITIDYWRKVHAHLVAARKERKAALA